MLLLKSQFRARGPWVTCFNIDGVNYGGGYGAQADHRLLHFRRIDPSPGRVLELGCLEGGHSFALADSAREVVAIDSREENLRRARWVRSLLGTSNVHFHQANLEDFSAEAFGTFDWVLNIGLLYHLPEPWKLLRTLAPIASRMFLWTHVAPEAKADAVAGGYRGMKYEELGTADPLSGMSVHSFWPTLSELERMLFDAGFDRFERLSEEPHHPHGPAVLLECRSRYPVEVSQAAEIATAEATH